MRKREKFLWAFFILCIAAALAFYASTLFTSNRSASPAAVSTLAAHEPVPDFHLTDQGGHAFERRSLAGRVWIADFIFTSCAGACPVMTQMMAALQRALPADIHLVSFTVDPARDTPSALAEYARQYAVQENRWHFLTGRPAAIEELVQKGFHLSYAEGGGAEEPIIPPPDPAAKGGTASGGQPERLGSGGGITHSQRFALVDAAGVVRGYYDSTEPAALQKLQSDARALLAESRR